MRPIEIAIALVSSAVIVSILCLRGRRTRWLRMLALAAAILFLAHAWFEGVHWQMSPIYLAIALFLFGLSNRGAKRIIPLAYAAGAMLLLGLAFCWILPMFHLPKPTGPYPVGTRTYWFIDPNRMETHSGARPGHREVVVQIWYPSATRKGKHAKYRRWKETDWRSSYQAVLPTASFQDAPVAAGRFPVVLLNPAWDNYRNRYNYITQELASQGFVVVGISHPYNAARVELHDGSVALIGKQPDLGNFWLPLTLAQRQAIADSELAIQTADDRFVLDELTKLDKAPKGPLSGHLDMTRVGACGHSFGGTVSVELAATDARVLSALEFDGAIYGKAAKEGLAKPLMRINRQGSGPPPGTENLSIQVYRVWWQMSNLDKEAVARTFSQYGGYNVMIQGISHESFDDKGFFSPLRHLTGIGRLSQQQTAKIVITYVVAFFRQTLLNEPQPLLSGAAKPPDNSTLVIWPRHEIAETAQDEPQAAAAAKESR